jgi:uncharacterized protein (DUF1499 family)
MPGAGRRLPWYVQAAFVVAAAGFALVALPGPMYRFGLIDLGPAFTGMRWGAYAGIGGIALCLIAGIVAFLRAGRRGLVLAVVGIVLGGIAFYLPTSMRAQARSVPAIHDITTDLENPPAFVAIAPLRAEAPNPVTYAGEEVAAQQRNAYPDLQPTILKTDMATAFPKAEAAARSMGWEIVEVAPAEGRIEATATTGWWGFKDDVVIRLREAEGGIVLDVRSKSRVGRSDLGANAARIRAYLAKVAG